MFACLRGVNTLNGGGLYKNWFQLGSGKPKLSPLWLENDIARNDNATYISTIDKVAKCKVLIFPVWRWYILKSFINTELYVRSYLHGHNVLFRQIRLCYQLSVQHFWSQYIVLKISVISYILFYVINGSIIYHIFHLR